MNEGNTRQNKQIKYLSLTGLMAAMTFVVTYFVKIPWGGGYVHPGDAVIYIFACILPMPYAMVGGAIGAGLADFTGGYFIYIAPTMIIKAAYVLFFTPKSERILRLQNSLAPILAGIVCILGYSLFDLIVFGGWGAILTAVPRELVQSTISAALFFAIAAALDAAKVKKYL